VYSGPLFLVFKAPRLPSDWRRASVQGYKIPWGGGGSTAHDTVPRYRQTFFLPPLYFLQAMRLDETFRVVQVRAAGVPCARRPRLYSTAIGTVVQIFLSLRRCLLTPRELADALRRAQVPQDGRRGNLSFRRKERPPPAYRIQKPYASGRGYQYRAAKIGRCSERDTTAAGNGSSPTRTQKRKTVPSCLLIKRAI
jgi:hypothetical protein